MPIATVIVRINAVLFLLYGIGFIFFPEAMAQMVSGSAPSQTSALIDMRATYGGMSAGIGLLLFALGNGQAMARKGLLGVVLLMVGMASGRLYGIVVDGSPNLTMHIYLGLELAMATVAIWAMSKRG